MQTDKTLANRARALARTLREPGGRFDFRAEDAAWLLEALAERVDPPPVPVVVFPIAGRAS